jgi:hypothetical protein
LLTTTIEERMRKWLAPCSTGLLALLAVGCSASSKPEVTEGNPSLGISEFQVSESKELTTIMGLDAQSREVGRLELVHGRFVPTTDLGQAPGESIDGRKLTVKIADQSFAWETIGYSDTTHMPQLPLEENRVAAFVADEHVRPLLQDWRIGWEGAPIEANVDGEQEAAYSTVCGPTGSTAPSACESGGTNKLCSIGDGRTTMACAGGLTSGGYSVQYGFSSTYRVLSYAAFCCGPASGSGGYAWKSCATQGVCAKFRDLDPDVPCTTDAQCPSTNCTFTSACGTTFHSQTCQACVDPAIPYSRSCQMSTSGTSICHNLDPCQPSCTGKSCGSDGCGGSCGSCGAGASCDSSGQCVSCDSSCSGCGYYNGCGAYCGCVGACCNGVCTSQDLCE